MQLDTDLARRNMIRQQVRTWDVHDPAVLDTLAEVPRELFVAERYANLAFADVMLPIAPGQAGDHASEPRRMLNPKIEGRLLQALAIRPADQVLIMGTGSGFLTACCAHLARHVTSIDTSAALIDAARARLAELALHNVDLAVQAHFDRPGSHEFDCIIVNGSLPVYDERIESWLKPGGRAFVIVGTGAAMEACLIVRGTDGPVTYHSLFETSVPPLPNAPQPEAIDLLA